MLQEMEAMGLIENTLIIFIGDNGPPGINGKTTSYEYGTLVPFIISWKGKIKSGQVSSSLISTLDIAPTILKAAGVNYPALPLAGEALQPLFEDAANQSVRKFLFTEMNFHDARMYNPQRTVRGERWKLVANLDPNSSEKKPLELFDLENDPHEKNNLIDSPDAKKQKQWLSEKLKAWQQETGDPLLSIEKQKQWSDLAKDWIENAPRSKGPYPNAGGIPEGQEPLLWK
jgi:N-sulfoglucosamine sulfohydrolase